MEILFVGNSFTSRNDLPGLLRQLAAAVPEPVDVRTALVSAGGASLRRHFNSGEAAAAVGRQQWDWVVLQEQSTLPIKNRGRFHENVRLLVPLIAAAGARTAFYSTWARREHPELQAVLDESIAAIAAECGGQLVPVGAAWRAVLNLGVDLELYEADGSHPSMAGSVLAAATFAASLFSVDPASAAVRMAPAWGLDPEVGRILGRAAWQTAKAAVRPVQEGTWEGAGDSS